MHVSSVYETTLVYLRGCVSSTLALGARRCLSRVTKTLELQSYEFPFFVVFHSLGELHVASVACDEER